MQKYDHKAFKIATELVAFIIVSIIIGNFLDKLFASRPIFVVICSLLGMIAAFRAIYRHSSN